MLPVHLAFLSVTISILPVLTHGSPSPQTVTLFNFNDILITHGLTNVSAVETIGGSTVYALPPLFITKITSMGTVVSLITSDVKEIAQSIMADSAGVQFYQSQS